MMQTQMSGKWFVEQTSDVALFGFDMSYAIERFGP